MPFLRRGFNSRSVSSVVISNNIATATTSAAHGYFVDDVIQLEGCNESIFNDSFKITGITSTTFTFPIQTALTGTTGTITAKIAPLGWDRVFTGTNKAVFRAKAGNRLYLRVDDTQAQYATMTMYESMTDIDTGTGSSTVYWKKSNGSDANARPYWIIGNDKMFYFFCAWHSSFTTGYSGACFGETFSRKNGDNFNSILIGYNTTTPIEPSANQRFTYCSGPNTSFHFIARSHSQVGSSIPFYKQCLVGGQLGFDTFCPYPNPVDSGLHLVPLEIFGIGAYLRGRMSGLFAPVESTNGYFFSGDRTVIINNKPYLAIRLLCYNQAYGNCFMSLDSGDWQ